MLGRKTAVPSIIAFLISLAFLSCEKEKQENSETVAVAEISRAERLIVNIDGGRVAAPKNLNPFPLGARMDAGMHQCIIEALFYYNQETAETIPWQAEGYKYNNTYDEVTINIRKGVEWSDGQPFTAEDVVFTINMLIKHAPILTHSPAMKEWMKEIKKLDDHTVHIVLSNLLN